MSENRKQHYVPRTYLSLFANDKNQIHIYDKKLNKHYNTNIYNAMQMRDFYTVELLDNKLEWEHLYSDFVEPLFKHELDNIVKAIVSWRSLPYTCCLPNSPGEGACQARSHRRWSGTLALLAAYAGVHHFLTTPID